MSVTQEQVQAWTTAMGVPLCIGELFASEHGARLPYDLSEFCQWANSTGRRLPDGSWLCNRTGVRESESRLAQQLDQAAAQLKAALLWADAHPGTTAAIAFALWLLATGRI